LVEAVFVGLSVIRWDSISIVEDYKSTKYRVNPVRNGCAFYESWRFLVTRFKRSRIWV